MRSIIKRKEPSSLKTYRLQIDTTYDGSHFTDIKNDIRKKLLEEQGYLCAYCMQRIDASNMKVEHWLCQDKFPKEQLNYRNMLGVCTGNEGQPYREQTCDTRKSNKDLIYNPAEPAHFAKLQVKYLGHGEICSQDQTFNTQLKDVLNLNWVRLKDNRASVLKAVIKTLSRNTGTCTRAQLNTYLRQWNTPDSNGMLKEYCEVAIYYLQKRLRKMN